MGTTANKLSYLRETKLLLKDKIEDLCGTVTDETTFEEYAEAIGNLYYDLPKVSGSGSEVVLNNCLGGKLQIQAKGNINQVNEPTPSSQQDVKVVTNNNILTIIKNNEIIITKELNLGSIELAMIPSYNLVDENNLTKATNTAQIENKIVTSAVLNSASNVASGFTIKIPTFKPEVGTYYVSADIRLVSGSVRNNEVTAVQMWAHDAWTASSSWASTPPTLTNQFQRYTRKYTISSIGTDANYIHAFYVQVFGATDAVLEFTNIQVSKENNNYIARDEYSDILFKNEISNIDYDNILVENAWYKKEKVGKQVITGTNSHGMYQNIYYITDISDYARANNIPYCNYFIGDLNKQGTTDTFTASTIAFNKDYNNNRVYIEASAISNDAAEVANWLNSHNLVLYYIKDNPTTTQITDTALIEQLEALNRTIISGGTITVATNSGNNAQLQINTSTVKGKEV